MASAGGGLNLSSGNANVGIESTVAAEDLTPAVFGFSFANLTVSSGTKAGDSEAFVGIKNGDVGAALSATAFSMYSSLALRILGFGLKGTATFDVLSAGAGGKIGAKEFEVKGSALLGVEMELQILTPGDK